MTETELAKTGGLTQGGNKDRPFVRGPWEGQRGQEIPQCFNKSVMFYGGYSDGGQRLIDQKEDKS